MTADDSTSGPPSPAGTGAQARATALLGRPKLWLLPTVLTGLLALLLSLLYMGGIVSPNRDLHDLPIGIVNADRGEPLTGQQENLGTQITRSVINGTSGGGDKAEWRELSLARAQDQLDSGKLYGVLVVPEGFTDSVAALTGTSATARPTLTVLTNPGKGSLGSSLASQITTQAAHQASATIGAQLTAGPTRADATAKLLLADPVTVTTQVGHPIGTHSGLGLSTFYYTLLLVLAGFLGANVISNGVDTSLGYADNEIGPWHTRRPTVPVDRTQTLLLKMGMTAGITLLSVSLVMLATVGILDMDADHLPLLWLYSYCATLAVGLGVQAINAAFGGIGQLVSMFVFIVLGLPSSGATVPLQAVPGFYQFLAVFEPMRQLGDGVRAILYFDAQGDAGLTRAWTMIAIGAALALLFGFAMTRYYDRKGLERRTPQPA